MEIVFLVLIILFLVINIVLTLAVGSLVVSTVELLNQIHDQILERKSNKEEKPQQPW